VLGPAAAAVPQPDLPPAQLATHSAADGANVLPPSFVNNTPVDLGTTYTNSFVIDANKALGYSG
jgi:hypothetical protein